jgi:hypothetical protein
MDGWVDLIDSTMTMMMEKKKEKKKRNTQQKAAVAALKSGGVEKWRGRDTEVVSGVYYYRGRGRRARPCLSSRGKQTNKPA